MNPVVPELCQTIALLERRIQAMEAAHVQASKPGLHVPTPKTVPVPLSAEGESGQGEVAADKEKLAAE